MLDTLKTLSIDGISLKQLLVNDVLAWEESVSYANQVLSSTDSSGNLFNGLGYMNVYRINSSGSEKSSSIHCITGFIPCKAGDIIRFCLASGTSMWTDRTDEYSSFNFFDSSYANLGQFTSQPAVYGIFSGTTEYNNVTKNGNVWEYTVPNNASISYLRMTAPYVDDNGWIGGADLIITVNEEIS